MAADLKVVPIVSEPRSLQDIPEMLRRTAERIENGEIEDCTSCFVLIPRPGDYPIMLGFGDVEGGNDPIIQLELGKNWFVTNLVKRT